MNSRELFGVGVRLLGVWFWAQAAYWGYWTVLKSASVGLGNPNVPAREDLAYVCLYLLLGSCLFMGARWLTWLAYGDAIRHPSDTDPAVKCGPSA